MSEATFTFTGFDELEKKLDRMAKKLPEKADQFLAQEAELVLGRAKDNTPVDTGRLRNSWQRTRPENGRVEVYNSADYAAHVEYGHRQRPGRFVPAIGKRLKEDFVPGKKMLHRAMEESVDNFKEDATEIMRGIFGD